MNTVKIADAKIPCIHPEHNPPSHISYTPWEYRHTCPWCWYIQEFSVPLVF